MPPASPIDRNGIVVDRLLRTTNRRVYAIGDVVAGPALASRADLSCRSRAPLDPLPPAGPRAPLGRRRGDLHRSGAGPRRAERGRRARASTPTVRILRYPLRRERTRPDRTDAGRHDQGRHQRPRPHPRRRHRRPRGGRDDRAVVAGDRAAPEPSRPCSASCCPTRAARRLRARRPWPSSRRAEVRRPGIAASSRS